MSQVDFRLWNIVVRMAESRRVKWNPVVPQKFGGRHNESSRTRYSNGRRGGVKDRRTNTGMRRSG